MTHFVLDDDFGDPEDEDDVEDDPGDAGDGDDEDDEDDEDDDEEEVETWQVALSQDALKSGPRLTSSHKTA